ncbi:unnamed protein product [Candidula unifasciata]|uniref:Folliculin n=1 Tax=Candidula unifasciata TaxID=100452 RepID=A0A8S3ZI25_9EUPU|nr:unnamed protein product [Candidula unifasciata]
MNAIISLCHFCELHGPKILYCTQPFRPQEPKQLNGEETEVNIPHRLKSASSQTSCTSADILPASSSAAVASAAAATTVKEQCEGCKSVQTGYVSHDEEAQVSYVSTQQPYNPQVFTRIRQACIRSLSSEVCPGREGPIFFGDKQCGHVLSYTFYVPDSQARGMHRWYSIIVVMMDKIYLLNSWPFLVPHLRIVIENLQHKAQKVYDQEESKCPQRPYRMGARVEPISFIKQRGGNKPARSLQELTGDKHVFQMLHMAFLWILKACGSRITETLLEGPPTEDTIIDMEKQEETEEGFIKIFTRKIDEDDLDSENADDPLCPVIKNLRQLRKVLGSSQFLTLAHHVVVGNQVIVVGRQCRLVKSILDALKILLPKGCCRVIAYSKSYQESWKCNFLGLSPDVSLSQLVNSSEMYVLLEIVDRRQQQQTPLVTSGAACLGMLTWDTPPDEEDLQFTNLEFKLSAVVLPHKVPTVLSRMVMALQNENLSLQVVDAAFTCLKEEWMNKVKVLFKFTKAGGNRSDDDTRKLLQIVGAREEDKLLLKFWMTGLSVQYKNHIRTSSVHR